MISMKVVNKWNRRLLRAVRRTGSTGRDLQESGTAESDACSIGSNDDDVRVSDGTGTVTRTLHRRSRESIMEGLPPPGQLSQQSKKHLDLLYALAYPKREKGAVASPKSPPKRLKDDQPDEAKAEDLLDSSPVPEAVN
jgi:hypothetical protein